VRRTLENNIDIPKNLAIEAAIRYINDRILANLKYSPNEVLLSLMINAERISPAEFSGKVTPEEAGARM